MRFQSRSAAGQALAKVLSEYADRKDVLVLALPRGGVPIAFEIAKTLNLEMDLMMVRKLGVPGHEELAMGAIAWGDICNLNQDLIDQLGIPRKSIERVLARERSEMQRRSDLYRGSRPPPKAENKIVIVVDDGLATGATMSAAVAALRQAKARKIVVAVPVAAIDSSQALLHDVDRIVCLTTPESFHGVGYWYHDFSQVSDAQVQDMLAQIAAPVGERVRPTNSIGGK